LYYRLNVIQIELPSLRERIDDLPLLVHHFVEKFAKELGKTIHGVSDEMMSWLHSYSFPGNVRELENIIERGVALTRGEYIEADCLPTLITAPQGKDAEFAIPSEGVDLEALVADYERRLLRQALERAGGIKKKAAQLLHVSFRSFRYRLEKLGLDDSGEAE